MQGNMNLLGGPGNGNKKKIFNFLLPALPGIFFVFTIAAFISIIMYPIIKGGQLIAGVGGFWERFTNAITLKCFFCSDQDLLVQKENKFQKKIEKLNQTYLNGKNMNGTSIQLDIPLLLSAIFYTEDIEETIFEEAEAVDQSEDMIEDMGDASSGDLFGDLSWYYDQGDQKSIDWFRGATEAEGCYIKGYNYYAGEQVTFGKKSKLRRLAKHMVKKVMKGTCTAVHDKEGKFVGWRIREYAEYVLDIERDDSLYTMEYDQQPYSKYRTADEISSLPPTFITYLVSTYLPDQFSNLLPKKVRDLSQDHELYLNKRKAMKNVIYSYKEGYKYLVGKPSGSEGLFCGEANGNCSYDVTTVGNKPLTINNVKVKLLQCQENRGQPIPGEELVDLETYVTGVLYAENGGASYGELKVHSIAIRSFLLARGGSMGISYFKMYEENGSWVVPIRNCTEDQVYCDPNKGCTLFDKTAAKTVRSGKHDNGLTYKPPLSADSNVRKAVAETTGKVLVDSDGEIFLTGYDGVNNNLKKWQNVLANGGDTYEALVSTYGSDKVLKSNCTGSAGSTANPGNETYYKQGDYPTVPYCSGKATLASSGCFPTAFAMVVENLTGKVTPPKEIAEYICNDVNGSRKYRVDGVGSNIDFTIDPLTQSHFNITSRKLSPNEMNMTSIIEKLKSGKKLIVSLQGAGGRFSSGVGHIIVLSGVTPDGKIKVLDPGHVNSTGNHSVEIIKNEVLTHLGTGIIEVSANDSTGTKFDGCYTGATGDYIDWRQNDKTWGSIPLGTGGATLTSAGCLATSMAKLIVMSGTKVSINNFNPGTMVQYLNSHEGFSGSNWRWEAPQESGLAPNFVHGGIVTLKGKSKSEKLSAIKNYLDQGYYLALQVKCDGTEEPGQHWVAVLGVTDTDIIMSDPASNNKNVWSEYKPGGTVLFHYYKKMD